MLSTAYQMTNLSREYPRAHSSLREGESEMDCLGGGRVVYVCVRERILRHAYVKEGQHDCSVWLQFMYRTSWWRCSEPLCKQDSAMATPYLYLTHFPLVCIKQLAITVLQAWEFSWALPVRVWNRCYSSTASFLLHGRSVTCMPLLILSPHFPLFLTSPSSLLQRFCCL